MSATSLGTTRRVVDAPTRMFHWLLALCFVGAYLTSESERLQVVHAAFGYSMLALLVFRLLYGWLGPRPVRWTSLATRLRSGWAWCRSLRSPKNVFGMNSRAGQNFALVLATSGLLVLPMPLLLSGHVLYTGSADWLEEVHELAANAITAGRVKCLRSVARKRRRPPRSRKLSEGAYTWLFESSGRWKISSKSPSSSEGCNW